MANTNKQIHSQLSIEFSEEDVSQAFSKGWFCIYYQPKVMLSNQNKILGAEAFVRLNHPQHGNLSPYLFLPLIKKSNRLYELTSIVLGEINQDLTNWQLNGFDLSIAINIDDVTIQSEEFQQLIESLINAESIQPHLITFEVSHASEIEWNEKLINALNEFRLKGFQVSLDDYTGDIHCGKKFSELPVDEVKINRNIITALEINPSAKGSARHIIHSATEIGTKVVAMGVENKKDCDWLTQSGCDIGQGFYLGKPLDKEEFFETFLSKEKQWEVVKGWDKPKVLLIEDDIKYQELFTDTLAELFELHVASNAKEALSIANKLRPEVLVVETTVDSNQGFEISKNIISEIGNHDCPILFLSRDDSTQNRISAFELGALDCINKPFSVNELIAKIHRATALQKQRIESHQDEKAVLAIESAKIIQEEAILYGSIVHLYRDIMHCYDEEALKSVIFDFLEHKGLQSSLQFRGGDSISTFDQRGIGVSPIEVNLFEILKDKGRLFEFNGRMIINYNSVSCLIRKMPDDKASAGVARDYLATAIEGAEIRYADILRQRTIRYVLSKLNTLASSLSTAIKKEVDEKAKLLATLNIELQMSFHVLDLTDEQEKKISEIINAIIQSSDQGENRTLDTIDNIESIIKELNQIVSSSNIEQLSAPRSGSDVEFF